MGCYKPFSDLVSTTTTVYSKIIIVAWWERLSAPNIAQVPLCHGSSRRKAAPTYLFYPQLKTVASLYY